MFFLGVVTAIGLTLCLTINTLGQKSKKKARTKPVRQVIVVEPDRRGIEAQLLKGENEHDGSGALYHIGTIESVPALLAVLKKYPVLAGGIMICTRAHALGALYKITGQKLGASYAEWESWWNSNKETLLKK